MKKSILLFAFIFYFIFSINARQPVVNLHKYNGKRTWLTPWKVTYKKVSYDACSFTLKCTQPGNITCKAPNSITPGGGGIQIGENFYDEAIISELLNLMVDDIDLEIYENEEASSGSFSKTYSIFDLGGEEHLVVFVGRWVNADQETGDADISIQMSPVNL